MTVVRVIKHFNKSFPDLTVTRVIDYDRKHYVVEALRDINSADYNCPYYGVDKNSGKITSFIPTLDLDAFFDAAENRTLYSADGNWRYDDE